MSIPSDKEDIYLRDDLHELASVTQTNNFNLRTYHHHKTKRNNNTLRIKYKNGTSHRMSTEPISSDFYQANSKIDESAINRLMVQREPDIKKRSTTTGLHSLENERFKTSYKSVSKFEETQVTEQQIERKCRRTQKKVNNGPLRKKIVETWLNTILTQCAQIEVVDETVTNAALKNFEIDENSLLSKGIRPQNVERIYRSLFVHSIGFNNNLKQIVEGRVQALKNIWKVYSTLLEYCAEGKFETLIGIIEREKLMKIEELREEIAKRQTIIEKNDELNEVKNIEIFREIKNLKADNINLNNEKEILYQDYQKTEQAFNEEVALRLKFENKINELFGVHRELGIKHQRLYDDYKKKIIEWTAVNQKNTQLQHSNWQLKTQVSDLLIEKEKAQKNIKYNSEYILSLKEIREKLKDENTAFKHELEEQKRSTKELNRRLSQCLIEISNLNEIVLIKDKSWKETHSEYQLSLQENNRLYQVINEQRTQVESLLLDKKQFNNSILGLMAEASFEKNKKEQFTKIYHQTDKRLRFAMEKLHDAEVQLQIKSARISSLEEDLNVGRENITKMHHKNIDLEEQLSTFRRFRDNLSPLIQQRDQKISSLSSQLEETQRQLEELKVSLGKVELKLKVTKNHLQNEIQSLKMRIQKLVSEREILESSDTEKNGALKQLSIELQKYTKMFQSTLLNYKNEKFERVNLKANYDQSLNIIEKKNRTEKELSIKISELEDSISRVKQENNRLNLRLAEEMEKSQRIMSKNQQILERNAELRRINSESIPMFIYQDVCENYRKMKEKLTYSNEVIRQKIEQYEESCEKYDNKIKTNKEAHQKYLKDLEQQKEKQLFQKESQLEYEKEKNQRMAVRLEELQNLAQTYTKKINERVATERQELYKQIIEEKSKSIDQLLKKNDTITKNYQQTQSKLRATEQQFIDNVAKLKKKHADDKQKFEEQIIDLKFEINCKEKENVELKKDIEESEKTINERVMEGIRLYTFENREKTKKNSELASEEGEREKRSSKSKWDRVKKIEQSNPEIKKRNEFARKIKFTHTYYKN